MALPYLYEEKRLGWLYAFGLYSFSFAFAYCVHVSVFVWDRLFADGKLFNKK
jgi:hypothetical protein